ncbi:hypothetical protein [Pontibacter actiniarum]|uniref:DUF4251 domain-containing protein n=1 Tax=Pontibacter actiniarum TaxID=323450 RepID=A0A1X9YS16_9BACT|nr:hypothetical protein [Pontibacter actiniarum]ARS35675.1 hypothetical protein CA264_09610 [Pontibacter actiniarum]
MKKLLLLLLLMPIAVLGQSINSTEAYGLNNIYYDALSQYLKDLDKSGIKYDTLYLSNQPEVVTDSLMTIIGNTFIKIVNENEGELSVILKDKDGIIYHYLFPLNFQNGQFYVPILPLRAKKEKGEIRLLNSGGGRAVYSFDQKEKQFKFIKYESWGI